MRQGERSVRLKTPDSYRDTSVSLQRSIANIESVLAQFGADATGVMVARRGDEAIAEIGFGYRERMYRIRLRLGTDPKDHRQRMRVLFWYVKAMLEAVAFGVVPAEEALLPYAELPDGFGGRTTVGKVLTSGDIGNLPQLNPEGLMALLGTKALPAPKEL